MFYFQLFLDLFFYGLLVFAIGYLIVEIYNNIHRHRRNIRRSIRVIKNWY